MDFNFFNEIQNRIKNSIENEKSKNIEIENLDNQELELAQKLDAIEEFSIDRFEENMAVIENRKTGEKENVNILDIPNDAKEGDIIKKINGKYYLDNKRTQEVEKELKEKYNNLWN